MRDYEIAVHSGREPSMAEAFSENHRVRQERQLQRNEASIKPVEGYFYDQMPPSSSVDHTRTPFLSPQDSGVMMSKSPDLPSSPRDRSKSSDLLSHHLSKSPKLSPPPRHLSNIHSSSVPFRRSHVLLEKSERLPESSLASSPVFPESPGHDVVLTSCQRSCFEALVITCLDPNPVLRPSAAAAAHHLALCCCSTTPIKIPPELTRKWQDVGLCSTKLSINTDSPSSPGPQSPSDRRPSSVRRFASMRVSSPPPASGRDVAGLSPLRSFAESDKYSVKRSRTPGVMRQFSDRLPTRPASVGLDQRRRRGTDIYPSLPTSTLEKSIEEESKSGFSQYVVSASDSTADLAVFDCSSERSFTIQAKIHDGDKVSAVDCVDQDVWVGTVCGFVHVFQLLPHDTTGQPATHALSLKIGSHDDVWPFPSSVVSMAALWNKLLPLSSSTSIKQSSGVVIGLEGGQVAFLHCRSGPSGRPLPRIKRFSSHRVRLVTASNAFGEVSVCCGGNEIVLIDSETFREVHRWAVPGPRWVFLTQVKGENFFKDRFLSMFG